jgi:hypothetical protein
MPQPQNQVPKRTGMGDPSAKAVPFPSRNRSHVAPIILGSGIAGISLPTVDSIAQGLRVHAEHFTLDGELLLTCAPERSRPA